MQKKKKHINMWYRQIGKEVGEVWNVFEDKIVILGLIRSSNSSDQDMVLAGNQWRVTEEDSRSWGESQKLWSVWTDGKFGERR